MANTLKVILWDKEIGRLAWDRHRRTSYFTFNPEFVKKGIDSPYRLNKRQLPPIRIHNRKEYKYIAYINHSQCP